MNRLTALRKDTEQLSEMITKNEHDLIEGKDKLAKLENDHNELINDLHE